MPLAAELESGGCGLVDPGVPTKSTGALAGDGSEGANWLGEWGGTMTC